MNFKLAGIVKAFEYISDISKNNVELNERVLKQMHYLVLKGIDKKTQEFIELQA